MCAEAAARHKADLDAHYNLLILERQARDAESRAAIAAEEQASKDRIEQYTQYSLQLLAEAQQAAGLGPLPGPPEPAPVPENQPLPGSVKLSPPEAFSGRNRAQCEDFINRVEAFRDFRELHSSIMSLVPSLLTGDAGNWHRKLQQDREFPVTWAHFCVKLRQRFGDPNMELNARQALDHIPIGRPVAELRANLECQLVYLPSLSESECITSSPSSRGRRASRWRRGGPKHWPRHSN